jgi:hypothetical protein
MVSSILPTSYINSPEKEEHDLFFLAFATHPAFCNIAEAFLSAFSFHGEEWQLVACEERLDAIKGDSRKGRRST